MERNPMNRNREQLHRWLLATMCVATLLVSACGTAGQPVQMAPDSKEAPSRLEPIDGSELSRVILTDLAAMRLDIQTQPIRTEDVDGAQRTLIPYAAVIYDLEGHAWVYTSPSPLTFVRANIEVDSIEGDTAVVASGPPVGTPVVTVGGAELYGAEFEFQEG
jgi:hypothetical protein